MAPTNGPIIPRSIPRCGSRFGARRTASGQIEDLRIELPEVPTTLQAALDAPPPELTGTRLLQ